MPHTISISGEGTLAERLVVVRLSITGRSDIVYDGTAGPVVAAAGAPQKNGQRRVGLARLVGVGPSMRKPGASARS
jgi:hypothetical protein